MSEMEILQVEIIINHYKIHRFEHRDSGDFWRWCSKEKNMLSYGGWQLIILETRDHLRIL